jgi:hypothetical protein
LVSDFPLDDMRRKSMETRDKWEYLTRFMYANTGNEGAMEYYFDTFPGNKPKKYAPETMIPEMDELGNQGWELVHMQPIGAVGKNHDVGFIAGDAMPRWSNSYFCVFKRKKF